MKNYEEKWWKTVARATERCQNGTGFKHTLRRNDDSIVKQAVHTLDNTELQRQRTSQKHLEQGRTQELVEGGPTSIPSLLFPSTLLSSLSISLPSPNPFLPFLYLPFPLNHRGKVNVDLYSALTSLPAYAPDLEK